MVRLKFRDVCIFLDSDPLFVLSYCRLRLAACRIESGGFHDVWSPMRLNIRSQKLPGFINVYHRLPEEKHPRKDYHFWTPLFCHRFPFFTSPYFVKDIPVFEVMWIPYVSSSCVSAPIDRLRLGDVGQRRFREGGHRRMRQSWDGFRRVAWHCWRVGYGKSYIIDKS